MRFRQESIAAADRSEPTTLRTITRAAGWSDNWDHVVEIRPNMTSDEINLAAGTSGICWKGIPEDSAGDDVLPTGSYLFLDGSTVKQTTSWWETSNKPFDFSGTASAIQADEQLVASDPGVDLRPQ
ncbi:hypothetical protein ACFWUP_05305 [Nocardia sp. NPDC058658]|uniref:hypothetical protein n=1 Tax=Nocardia sp. NPDC058658 TaxID=3346580 RepID=UPI0036470469